MKLDNRFKGPYEVIQQRKNEVEARHLSMGWVRWMVVDRLKLFVGTNEEAKRLANEDADQFVVKAILAWRGNPNIRTTMEFEVEFEDGDIIWKVWDQDLTNTLQFETFCNEHRELSLLLLTVKMAKQESKRINGTAITEVQPGDTVYVDLRYFNTQLYDTTFDLEDKFHVSYVVPVRYTKWSGKNRLHIDAHINLWDTTYTFSHLFVHLWGHRHQVEGRMIEVTRDIMKTHISLLELVPDKKGQGINSKRFQNIIIILSYYRYPWASSLDYNFVSYRSIISAGEPEGRRCRVGTLALLNY